ncbi:MAG: cation transporter [Ktedonobacteraceae bacterium]|nr:cation transporter [Ktedonobacteraceae bacterium]
MSRWLYFLLLAIPAALIAEGLHASPLVIFVLAALGLIPLAGMIGVATEALAERLGHGIGGLLNATFGNAAEIIIGIVALTAGLPEVVRASLAGSIIGNALLVLGLSMFVGGWRYRRQRFSRRGAGQYSTMLVLSVIGMAIPSLLATIGEGTRPGAVVVRGNQLHQISIGVALILLVCYAAYIAYSVFGVRAHPKDVQSLSPHVAESETTGHTAGEVHGQPAEEQAGVIPQTPVPAKARPGEAAEVASQDGSGGFIGQLARLWKTAIWLPILVLAVATAATAFMSEVLVGTIDPLTKQIGWNQFFVGLIIIPLVGNAAEHFSAVTFAHRNHMEVSMAITAGSSIQIALLAAPILVVVGLLLGVPLDLNFTLLEIALFGLVAGLYALISLDGESTWLEGLLLLAFYLILAVGTFVSPV